MGCTFEQFHYTLGYHGETVTVDITIPSEAYAKNEVTIRGMPRGEEGSSEMTILKVNTPASYGFELGYESDLDRGIKFNDTLLLNLSVKNLGNAEDELNFKFTHVPSTWNISIGETWLENAEVKYDDENDTFIHKILQQDIYKNVTIKVMSPAFENASLNEKIDFRVGVWSANRPDIENSQIITVTLRNPDLILKDIRVLNTDLKENTNITIRANVQNKHCYTENVNFSLFVNNVLIKNKTMDRLEEDIVEQIEFNWDPTESNFTASEGQYFTFQIVVNGDNSIEEIDYDNNAIGIRKFVGERPEEEEFNWRPIYALISLLIIFIAIYAVYRWRKKF